ncbi:MAG: porin family protein [Magnetococcales bacterium]|nr:porin family protein [Magnetococcales bacterium]
MRKFAILSGILLPLCLVGTAQTEETSQTEETPAATVQTEESPLPVPHASGMPTTRPYYVSLKLGGSFPNKTVGSDDTSSVVRASYDDAATVAVAVGMRLHPTVRLELEGSYRKYNVNTLSGSAPIKPINPNSDSEVKTVMGNLYYDLPVKFLLQPYLIGGVGVASSSGSASYGNMGGTGRSTNFAYQLGGGFLYPLDEAFSADIGYRYIGVGSKDDNHYSSERDDGAHEVLVGLQYGFYGF